MSFDEIRFSDHISASSAVGPTFKTSVVESAGGNESRLSLWSQGRLVFDISYGIRSALDIATIVAFFRACKGRAIGFRFKDFTDYTSASNGISAPDDEDQIIGIGDGVTKAFQLIKLYTNGLVTYTRDITKPVTSTVLAAKNGVSTTAFTVNYVTGIITFTTAPALDAVITAGFEFDVPVRFNSDSISISLAHIKSGSAAIELLELRT